ncbi:MAG: N-acetyltransferase [Candidatus Pacearchaeota archaeon]
MDQFPYPNLELKPGLNINKNLFFNIKDLNNNLLNELFKVLDEVKVQGVFKEEDVKIAREVINEKLSNLKNYNIKIVESSGNILGFICYDKSILSDSFYDLYWIAVLPSFQKQGIGTLLMNEMERDVKAKGGKAIILETSSSENYLVARHMYEKLGYKLIAKIENFYSEGEDKLIYKKDI